MFRRRTGFLLLICAGLLLYINALTNAFLSDDRNQILNNPQLHNLANIPSFFLGSTYYSGGGTTLGGLYYRPVMMTAYALIYAIAGNNPLPFHLVQIIIHIINALLVDILFCFFFSEGSAFLLALLFLILPVNNEAVVYIANLQDVLFVCFGLVASIIFIFQKKHLTKKNVFLLSLFLLLSLFTKETAIVFLCIIFLYRLLYKRKEKKIIIALISCLCVYVCSRYFLAHIGITKSYVLAPIASIPLVWRLINLPYIFFTYLERFFFPYTLTSSDYSIVKSFSFIDFYLPLILSTLFIVIIFIIGKWIQTKHKKYFIQFLFFACWFFIGLLPHMQIIPLDQTVAERWFYFSGIGLLGLLATGVQQVKMRNILVKRLSYILLTIVCVLLSARTFIRTFDWKDGITLYSHDIAVTKESFLLDNALATELLINGDYQKAKPYVFASIRQYPFYANLNNAAIVSLSEKNVPRTKYYLQQALLYSGNYAVYENYANFLLAYASPQETYDFGRIALKKYPNDYKILFDYGKASVLLGKATEALAALKKSEDIAPNRNTETLLKTLKQNHAG